MSGLDIYSTTSDLIGVDWLDTAGSVLKTAGGAFGGGFGGGSGQAAPAQAQMQVMQAQMQAEEAKRSASTWKMIGIGGAVAVVLGFLLLKK